MAVPGLTVVASVDSELDDMRRLLGRALTVLRGVIQEDPDKPLGRVQIGIASRLHNDIRDALEL